MALLENFIVSVTAVLPLFLMIALGSVIRIKSWLSPQELRKVNGVIFRLLFPILLFDNIRKTELSSALRPQMLLYAACGILLTYGVARWLVPKFVPSPKTCGAMIQSTYRSNFVLLGLPLVGNLFPDADLGMTALAIGILIPLYNVLAVITLEEFRGGQVRLGKMLKNLLTNPMILGCAAGLLAMPFELPPVLASTLHSLASTATPIALLLLGASFHFQREARIRRYLTLCVLVRLVLAPAVFLPLAAMLGFRGLPFATLLGVFATPASVTSFVMAQQMDSDAEVAGAVVVYGSFFSCFSLCLWIFLFKQLGVL